VVWVRVGGCERGRLGGVGESGRVGGRLGVREGGWVVWVRVGVESGRVGGCLRVGGSVGCVSLERCM